MVAYFFMMIIFGKMVLEVINMWEKKYHLYLTYEEHKHTIKSLIELKNTLIREGRYTDAVDDLLCKFLSAKEVKMRG